MLVHQGRAQAPQDSLRWGGHGTIHSLGASAHQEQAREGRPPYSGNRLHELDDAETCKPLRVLERSERHLVSARDIQAPQVDDPLWRRLSVGLEELRRVGSEASLCFNASRLTLPAYLRLAHEDDPRPACLESLTKLI